MATVMQADVVSTISELIFEVTKWLLIIFLGAIGAMYLGFRDLKRDSAENKKSINGLGHKFDQLTSSLSEKKLDEEKSTGKLRERVAGLEKAFEVILNDKSV